MNEERVALWGRSTTGVDTLKYDTRWLESPHRRPLSLSLPFLPDNQPHRGSHVSAWFENLLPDSADIRRRVAQRFHVNSNARSLLAEIGRDCVGAVQILPDGETPDTDTAVAKGSALTNAEVAHVLRSVTAASSLGSALTVDDFRISVAGAQEKTALLGIDGKWHRPRDATPSTHILKLPLGLVGSMRYDLSHSVDNEWVCLQLLRELGFNVANAEIKTFRDAVSEERVLIVERFDRAWARNGREFVRLPQEDFCQALGFPPTQKYENEGGPGIKACLQLLRGGEAKESDVRTFILAQLAFWLLAALDGHAKNFSIYLNRKGYVMTPLYDVISAWPFMGVGATKLPIQRAKLAMALRGKGAHYEIDRIHTRHWKTLADQSGLVDAFDSMTDLVERVPMAITEVESRLPSKFPEVTWSAIKAGMLRQRNRFVV